MQASCRPRASGSMSPTGEWGLLCRPPRRAWYSMGQAEHSSSSVCRSQPRASPENRTFWECAGFRKPCRVNPVRLITLCVLALGRNSSVGNRFGHSSSHWGVAWTERQKSSPQDFRSDSSTVISLSSGLALSLWVS